MIKQRNNKFLDKRTLAKIEKAFLLQNLCSKLTQCPIVLAQVSAIQDISLSPVLISGAGTSTPGPVGNSKNSFQGSSMNSYLQTRFPWERSRAWQRGTVFLFNPQFIIQGIASSGFNSVLDVTSHIWITLSKPPTFHTRHSVN